MPKITFKNPTALKIFDAKCIEVKPGTSILDAAEECHARVGHACGGNLACSTCHVYVEAGLDSLPEITDKENDIMDKAFDVRAESRLGCQAKVADVDIVVEITEESHRAWLDENPDERKKAPQLR
ncbi:MAG: 2Fe-2S iron-sulfur cluster-binding protein [Myxococcota bacterium]|nr:2Fe-2S iron-sulfur cluster-binding protein [Myxococcota bacterium]